MDEQRLGALFRDAVGDPPPATFGAADVVAAARRATVRRRNALTAGTLLGVAVLAGGLTIGGHVVQGHGLPGNSSTAGQQADTAAGGPGPRTLGASPEAESSAESEQTRCGPLDGELAAQLSAVLAARGVAIVGPPSEVPGPCSDGSRAAAVPVVGGTFYLLVAPPGWLPGAPRPDGARGHALTPDGSRELVVISIPVAPGQPAPLADQLPDLAQELANRF
ncbi:MAG: hypothetical protein ACT4NY_26665 [Pseudonocardiales bacterium]